MSNAIPLPQGRQRRSSSARDIVERAKRATEGIKLGRPLNYSDELCERAVKLGMIGKSWSAIAREFGISRNTLYEWEAAHPAFRDALSRARAAAQAWWEDDIQGNRKAKHYQAQTVARLMGAQFEDYRERAQLDVTLNLEGLVAALEQAQPKVIEGTAKTLDPASDTPLVVSDKPRG